MEWVWSLYEPYARKELARRGKETPSGEEVHGAIIGALGASTVTILVQEPSPQSVRFKGLARYPAADCMDLLNDPMGYLFEHYGGGKFKLNFHHGWHFVATHNFKPEGDPRWVDLPEIDF